MKPNRNKKQEGANYQAFLESLEKNRQKRKEAKKTGKMEIDMEKEEEGDDEWENGEEEEGAISLVAEDLDDEGMSFQC